MKTGRLLLGSRHIELLLLVPLLFCSCTTSRLGESRRGIVLNFDIPWPLPPDAELVAMLRENGIPIRENELKYFPAIGKLVLNVSPSFDDDCRRLVTRARFRMARGAVEASGKQGLEKYVFLATAEELQKSFSKSYEILGCACEDGIRREKTKESPPRFSSGRVMVVGEEGLALYFNNYDELTYMGLHDERGVYLPEADDGRD